LKKLEFIQTSVFTDSRYLFTGNQLATFVNLEGKNLTGEEMLGITREMNFSETTFVFPAELDNCIRKMRIFTPGREIPFAGHPTLGTTFVLKHLGTIGELETESQLELGLGTVEVKLIGKNQVMMLQQKPAFSEASIDKNAISNILGISTDLISSEWPVQFVSTGNNFLIVPLTSLAAMRDIKLNINLLVETLEDYPSQELVVVTPETVHDNSHVHTRMFAPTMGVIEDPATGSAAGSIRAYLETNEVLPSKYKGKQIAIEQGYEIHRPSRLLARCLYGEDEITGVEVAGNVKLVAEGTFFLGD